MATVRVPPLIEILAEIPDWRQARGRRYPLKAMLTLLCVGLMCKLVTVSAISEWEEHYGLSDAARFGFNANGYPRRSTWYEVLGKVDVTVLEAKLGGWAEAVLNALGRSGELVGLSVDGKTLRGSKKQGAQGAHLLSVVAHYVTIVLNQVPVDDKTNELGIVKPALTALVLQGRVVTGDALFTQKSVAELIVELGGDYVLPVKENQGRTYRDIAYWFSAAEPVGMPKNQVAQTLDKGHGRLTKRRLEATTVLNDHLDWTGLAQVFKLTRTTTYLKSGEVSREVTYGISSLTPQRAPPETLLAFVRGHWTIENRIHWVRDVIFDEDRCQLRVGSTHQLMAAMRNAVIGLMRIHGHHQIAKTLRHFTAKPRRAYDLLNTPL